jgi:hypothetical protein
MRSRSRLCSTAARGCWSGRWSALGDAGQYISEAVIKRDERLSTLPAFDCVVRRNAIGSGNTGNGVLFKPNGAGTLTISDSVFESNANVGISILPTGSAGVKAVLTRVETNSNSHGLFADSSAKTGGSVEMSVFNSVFANNSNNGIAAGAAAIIRIGESMVTENVTGWAVVNGGQVSSYGTNQVDGNTSADTITSKIPLD